ncbi:MAG TPA: hypothetical protein VK019_04910, partial [Pseudomonas sp.]|nr:hypothetical protein [Pseudomonas sp.]
RPRLLPWLFALACSQAVASESCYGNLTELVRSSNFPFGQIEPGKINLLIDDDTGDRVLARLRFDTEGTGTLGWIEYLVDQRQLFNVSADQEEPALLKFSARHAAGFEACRTGKAVAPDRYSATRLQL